MKVLTEWSATEMTTASTRAPRTARRNLAIAAAFGAVTATVFTLFSVRQWNRFESPSWDLGIFTQLAKSYSLFEAPLVDIKGYQFNLLGDHFHPILVVLGPIYALFPSGLTLLVVQNVLFGVGVSILTAAALRHSGTLAGVCIGLAFATSWGLQTAVEAQFHEIAFAVPLLAAALSCYLSGKWKQAAVWAAPLVFVKEDLGITVAVFGALLFYQTRDKRTLWLSAWGAGWTLAAVALILPAFNKSGSYAYGLGGGGAGGSILDSLFDVEKFQTIGLLLAITAGLALRSPLVLLTFPTLAWRMLSANESYWGTRWHYSAILMPILFAAAIEGIRILRSNRNRALRGYARAAPFVIVGVAIAFLPLFPLKVLIDANAYNQTSRADKTREVLAMVPDGARVETDITLMAYLIPRTDVFWWGTPGNPPPDYLLLDTQSGSWTSDFLAPSAAEFAERRLPGLNYSDLLVEDGYQVAKRDD